MQTHLSGEAIAEVERLLRLSVAEREAEGVYANDSQLKLLLKRIRSRNHLSGATKFVADFSSTDSRLLSLVDKLECNNHA